MKKIFVYSFYIFAGILFSGCLKDDTVSPAASGNGRLTLLLPDVQQVAVTRAATEAECRISNLYVLVYRSGALVYKQTAAAAAVTGNGTAQPSVELLYKLQPGDRVCAVANYPLSVGTALEGLATGSAESGLSPLLVYDNPVYNAAWPATGPQPMYGSVVWSAGSNVCPMVRSLAKVTVETGSSGLFAGKTVKYTLAGAPRKTSMEVRYDTEAGVYVVPGAAGFGGAWSTDVDTDGMTVLTAVNYCAPYPLATSAGGAEVDDDTFDKRRTAVILSLTASGSEEYYRLDFSRQLSSTSVAGDASNEYMDIRPNTHYIFRIESVNSSGYGSAAEAWANPGSNIEYTVTISGDGWKSSTSNGQYMVKTDRDTVLVVAGVSAAADLVRFAAQMPDAGQKPGGELPGSVGTRTVTLVGADRKTPVPVSQLQLCMEDGTPVADNTLDFSGVTIPADGYRLRYLSGTGLPSTAAYAKVRYGNVEHFVPLVPVTFDADIPQTTFTFEGKNNSALQVHSHYYDDATGRYVPCAWTTEFSADGGATWTAEEPGMLSGFPGRGAGSDPGDPATYPADYLFGVSAQTGIEINVHNDALRAASSVWGVHDLSTKGGATSMNTANCYVVNAPGVYTFPLVYGNAIKDGDPNPDAYTSSGMITRFILDILYNHLDVPVDDPYIYNNANCVPADAVLVWQDENRLVTGVSLDTEKQNIRFEVPSESIRQGNAIIAVRDASGTVLWSWHIWVTDYVPGDDLVQMTNLQGNQYTFFPVNIGWCDPTTTQYDAREVLVRITQDRSGLCRTFTLEQAEHTVVDVGNSPYYEWGRKDPMLPGVLNAAGKSADKPIYPGAYDFIHEGQGLVTIGTAIQNPHVFYKPSDSDSSWCSEVYYNFWDNNNRVSMTDIYAVGTKTIYDPSPVGYVVPPIGAWSGLTSSGSNSFDTSEFNVYGKFDSGWNFYCVPGKTGGTTFYPAIGSRYNTNGKVYYVKESGGYWSGTPYSTFGGYYMSFGETSLLVENTSGRARGLGVRPIRE